MEEPGPGRCDVCGERVPSRHPFLVQVKNVGVGLGARTSAHVNVVGAHCERCDRHFQAFRARRLQAIATMVLGALLFAPLMGVASMVAGAAGPWIAVGIVGALVLGALARVATWHESLRERLGDGLLDDLARGLPDPPGLLRWSEVRFFPEVPRGVEARLTLGELRGRAGRVRSLPN